MRQKGKITSSWIIWFKHRQLCANCLIYNTPIEETLCQNSHIQHSVITGKAWALKLVQLRCSKPTDLLHIWQGREELRHVHYHLLLSPESTKKVMRRREVSCQIFHFISQSSSYLSNVHLLLWTCWPNYSTDTYNANNALTANGKFHLHKWSVVTPNYFGHLFIYKWSVFGVLWWSKSHFRDFIWTLSLSIQYTLCISAPLLH